MGMWGRTSSLDSVLKEELIAMSIVFGSKDGDLLTDHIERPRSTIGKNYEGFGHSVLLSRS